MVVKVPAKVNKFITEITKKYTPGFVIKDKRKPEGLVYKFVRGIVMLFNKDFDTRFITVVNGECWVPGTFGQRTETDMLQTLSHETVHEYDRKKMGNILFVFLYLFPQIFTLLSLFALLAIWFSSWWLLCLGFLVCLSPLPAPGRMYIELRGYQMNMILAEKFGWNKEEFAIWDARQFTGASYYFMWPFKAFIVKRLMDTAAREQEPIFKEIVQWHIKNGYLV